jgi:CRISPR system Cascade subunit CasE
MYFSKARLNAGAEQSVVNMLRDGYRLHQALWRLFSDADRRDFLFRQIEEESPPTFYVVSQQRPEDDGGRWVIQSKRYEPKLAEGECLAFSLVANPVVARRDADTGRSARHDVVKDQQRRDPGVSPGELQLKAGRSWLDARAPKHGFRVIDVGVDSYRQHRMKSKAKLIQFSSLRFDGILEVVDPQALLATLASGIGPAKAFGCGLLLVRRVAKSSMGH